MELNYDDQQQANQIAGFIAKTFQILNNYFLVGIRIIICDQGCCQISTDCASKILQTQQDQQFHSATQHVWFSQVKKIADQMCLQPSIVSKNRQELLPQIKRKIKQNDSNQLQKFLTPVKANKYMKQQCETTTSGKSIMETKQNILSSCRQLSFLDNIGSSFKLLFDNKENLSRHSFNLNFSMNRISYNIFGNVQTLEQAKQQIDDDMISIENGIQKNKKEINNLLVQLVSLNFKILQCFQILSFCEIDKTKSFSISIDIYISTSHRTIFFIKYKYFKYFDLIHYEIFKQHN